MLTVDSNSDQEKTEVLRERVLANHCRFMASLVNEDKDAYLLKVIKRTWKMGTDLNLKFENFQDEFKTPKLKEALEWIIKNPPKKTKKA
jgi:hypothetical protein